MEATELKKHDGPGKKNSIFLCVCVCVGLTLHRLLRGFESLADEIAVDCSGEFYTRVVATRVEIFLQFSGV